MGAHGLPAGLFDFRRQTLGDKDTYGDGCLTLLPAIGVLETVTFGDSNL